MISALRSTPRTLSILSWMGYALALLWWALLPLVSITSGEPKPRSLFIDEKAIPPRMLYETAPHINTTIPHTLLHLSRPHMQNALCDLFANAASHMLCELRIIDEVRVLAVHFKHASKPISQECIVLVRPFFSLKSMRHALPALLGIHAHLARSPWLSKNVVILALFPLSLQGDLDPVAFHRPLAQWLDSHHSSPPSSSSASSSVLAHYSGVIRQAYIIQSDAFPSRSSLPSYTSLHIAGFDGQLPNLDLVTFAMSSLPSLSIENSSSSDTYTSMLSSLFAFALCMVNGPSGLHAHFLSRRIDSLTISTDDSTPGRRSAEEVHGLVVGLVRVSSFLHEALHHSYTQYVLFGNSYFASIDEFGYSIALIMAPLLALSHRSSLLLSETMTMHAALYLYADMLVTICLLAMIFLATTEQLLPLITSLTGVIIAVCMLIPPSQPSSHCLSYSSVLILLVVIAAAHPCLACFIATALVPYLTLLDRATYSSAGSVFLLATLVSCLIAHRALLLHYALMWKQGYSSIFPAVLAILVLTSTATFRTVHLAWRLRRYKTAAAMD